MGEDLSLIEQSNILGFFVENYIVCLKPNTKYSLFPKLYTEYTLDNYYRKREEELEARGKLCEQILFEPLEKSINCMEYYDDFVSYYRVQTDRKLNFNCASIQVLNRF